MKFAINVLLLTLTVNAWAFDFKGLVDKVSKDKKMQEDAKELAKKGYEYLKGEEKKEDTKKEETKKEEPKNKSN
jgi:hypothetical protein